MKRFVLNFIKNRSKTRIGKIILFILLLFAVGIPIQLIKEVGRNYHDNKRNDSIREYLKNRGWSNQDVKEYTELCENMGGSEASCTCALNKLESKFNSLKDMSRALKKGKEEGDKDLQKWFQDLDNCFE